MISDFVAIQIGWNDAPVRNLFIILILTFFVGYEFNRIGKSFVGIIISSLKHFHLVHSYESIPYCLLLFNHISAFLFFRVEHMLIEKLYYCFSMMHIKLGKNI